MARHAGPDDPAVEPDLKAGDWVVAVRGQPAVPGG
jgi:hypothetical protein